MKRFYFVCVAIGLMSTAGAGIVAAGTSDTSKLDTAATYQSAALEQLKAQASSTNTTWQRPL
ncbi:hypothetical protein [Steroidobacter cummioxidans]|uniref:hypothetical protein n=1 Tax=Steroidobacter cummioxidans TaxID=1803913 RepID=UPI000E312D05|nr:hypothetical protein [Steroidobacter cummioxidans]